MCRIFPTYRSVFAQMVSWPQGLGTVVMSERPDIEGAVDSGRWVVCSGEYGGDCLPSQTGVSVPHHSTVHRIADGRPPRLAGVTGRFTTSGASSRNLISRS